MAPQQSGIFKGFDIRDSHQLRSWLDAMSHIVGGGIITNHPTFQNLGSNPEEIYERGQTIRQISAARRTNPRLDDAILSFQGAWALNDKALIVAAGALHATFADFVVVDSHNGGSKGEGGLGRPSIVAGATARPTAGFGDHKRTESIEEQTYSLPERPRKAKRQRGPTRSVVLTDSTDSTPSSSSPTNERGRHAPNLQKGYMCYNDGSYPIDRSHAKLGESDPTKFTISLRSRKVDPTEPTGYLEGKGAVYLFHNRVGFEKEGNPFEPFDWNNKFHVKKLHQWREQVFRRRLGGTRSTRKQWMLSEKTYMLKLIKEQLKTHRRPKFNRLANDFNKHFRGTTQCKGMKPVYFGAAKNEGVLTEDRSAPWRTRSACEGQTFKWPEYHDMLRKRDLEILSSAEADMASMSSDDEDEIRDPTPIQTVFKPKDYRQWVGLKAANALKKGQKAAAKTAKSSPTAFSTTKATSSTKGTKVYLFTNSSRKTTAVKRKHIDEAGDDDQEDSDGSYDRLSDLSSEVSSSDQSDSD